MKPNKEKKRIIRGKPVLKKQVAQTIIPLPPKPGVPPPSTPFNPDKPPKDIAVIN